MKSPLFRDTDEIRQGASYLRRYSTGTLDTTLMTPRVTLQKRLGGAEVVDAVQMARLSVGTNPDTGLAYDPAYDWAMVVARTVTGVLDLAQYFINVDFDDNENPGQTIPHGLISLTVLPGVVHP